MKKLFSSCCLIISIACLGMQDCELKKISELQSSTHPLRNDLRKLKNAIAYHKLKLCSKEEEEKFKIDEECFKWRDGFVTHHLNKLLEQLDHVNMDIHSNKFIHIDKYFNRAQEYLNQASRELQEYKNSVKQITQIDIDSANL